MAKTGIFWTKVSKTDMPWDKVHRIMVETRLMLDEKQTLEEIAEIFNSSVEEVQKDLTEGLRKLSLKRAMRVEKILEKTEKSKT